MVMGLYRFFLFLKKGVWELEGMIRCHELDCAYNWLSYLTILSMHIVTVEKSGLLLFDTCITMLMLLLHGLPDEGPGCGKGG